MILFVIEGEIEAVAETEGVVERDFELDGVILGVRVEVWVTVGVMLGVRVELGVTERDLVTATLGDKVGVTELEAVTVTLGVTEEVTELEADGVADGAITHVAVDTTPSQPSVAPLGGKLLIQPRSEIPLAPAFTIAGIPTGIT